MYNINFDKYLRLVNWSCIYWGIREHIIDVQNAVIYAEKLAETTPATFTPEETELLIADCAQTHSFLSIIEKIFPNKGDLEKEKETSLRRLRLILLLDLQQTITDKHKLLSEAEDMYAAFGYPEDMESFISYMPVCGNDYDVSKHSPEENINRLTDNFNLFIDNEQKSIGTKEDEI